MAVEAVSIGEQRCGERGAGLRMGGGDAFEALQLSDAVRRSDTAESHGDRRRGQLVGVL